MRISACITTRNRTQHLEACLQALWNSQVKPYSVVVSDDSPDVEVQQQNQDIVSKYPGTIYVTGPQIGVCANRNNAVNVTKESETDFVAFVDDDILVEPDFIANAVEKYQKLSQEERDITILSGVSKFNDEDALVPAKLSFLGHFLPCNTPETVVIHAALFPRKFFSQEQWDENIYFGYEDAELCLRAIRRGYKIVSCPEMIVKSSITQSSTLDAPGIGGVSNYELHIEAARLYVGIKRYNKVFPNPFKLIAFLLVYFAQMSAYLVKNKAIQAWPEIIRRARLGTLWSSVSV